MFDIIIKNGTVIDGSGKAGYLADVAVKDGKIACIGNDISGGKRIIDATGFSVTPGFTLKILHKLVQGELVKSYKGVNGGYMLNRSPSDITLKTVIELIDGPIFISRCLENEEGCSMNPDKTACIYHHIFDTISIDVARKLEGITIADVLNKTYSLK